jgi:hypothetical protein
MADRTIGLSGHHSGAARDSDSFTATATSGVSRAIPERNQTKEGPVRRDRPFLCNRVETPLGGKSGADAKSGVFVRRLPKNVANGRGVGDWKLR